MPEEAADPTESMPCAAFAGRGGSSASTKLVLTVTQSYQRHARTLVMFEQQPKRTSITWDNLGIYIPYGPSLPGVVHVATQWRSVGLARGSWCSAVMSAPWIRNKAVWLLPYRPLVASLFTPAFRDRLDRHIWNAPCLLLASMHQ